MTRQPDIRDRACWRIRMRVASTGGPPPRHQSTSYATKPPGRWLAFTHRWPRARRWALDAFWQLRLNVLVPATQDEGIFHYAKHTWYEKKGRPRILCLPTGFYAGSY